MKEIVITKCAEGLKINLENDVIVVKIDEIRKVRSELSYSIGIKVSSKSRSKLVIYTNKSVFHFTTSGIVEEVKKVENNINKGKKIGS